MPAHEPTCQDEGKPSAVSGPPLTSEDRISLVTFVSDLRHLAAEVYEVNKDIHEIKSTLASMLLKMAETPVLYVSQSALHDLEKRVDSLESTRDADTPRFQDALVKLSSQRQQIDTLQLQRANTESGYRWLVAAGAVLYMLVNLAIASKGKLW